MRLDRELVFNILGYGLLLGVFLMVFDLGKRAQFSSLVSSDIYTLSVAFAFLAIGVGVAAAIFRLPKDAAKNKTPQNMTRKKPVLDGHDLSAREVDVLVFLAHGYFNKEISVQLKISENTVKFHLKNIYSKLDVANRTQAADEAKLRKII